MIPVQGVVLLMAAWFQYAVLRQYSRKSWFWIPLSALAASVAEATSLYIVGAHDLAAFWAATGCIYGIATGAGFTWIFRSERHEQAAQP